jgi:hypothetical protein
MFLLWIVLALFFAASLLSAMALIAATSRGGKYLADDLREEPLEWQAPLASAGQAEAAAQPQIGM